MQKILILDNGITLKISYNGKPQHIVKGQVRTIRLIKENIIELNLGLGALEMIYIPFPQVVKPVFKTAEELLDAIASSLDNVKTVGTTPVINNPPTVGI
jgi:hypothetical protein